MMDMLLKYYVYLNFYSISTTVEMQFTNIFGMWYVEDSYHIL